MQRSCERAWNKVNALSQYVEKLRDENIEMKEKLKDVQYLYRVMGKEKVNKIIQQGKEAETIDEKAGTKKNSMGKIKAFTES